jgi:putative ABC transport system permease protein
MAAIAIADLRREPVTFLCHVALVAGVLAPLLILLGVRNGVMETLMAELRDDPEKRRVAIVGNHALTEADIAAIAAWPEVGFVAPASRSIARRLYVRAVDGTVIRTATLFPTGPGEPLLDGEAAAVEGLAAVPSAALARRLGIGAGDRLEASITRGQPPTARYRLELGVPEVLAEGRLDGEGLLLPPDLLDEIEAFLDGYAVPSRDVTDGRDPATRPVYYESLRLYARDLDSVTPLVVRLESAYGLPLRSSSDEIARLLAFDRNLATALAVLVGAGVAGLLAALTAALWANVQRKRGALALLRLLGARARSLAVFPVVQALIVSLCGWLLALAGYALAARVVDRLFEAALAGGGQVARLAPADAVGLAGLTLLIAVLASAAAARQAASVDPALALKEG